MKNFMNSPWDKVWNISWKLLHRPPALAVEGIRGVSLTKSNAVDLELLRVFSLYQCIDEMCICKIASALETNSKFLLSHFDKNVNFMCTSFGSSKEKSSFMWVVMKSTLQYAAVFWNFSKQYFLRWCATKHICIFLICVFSCVRGLWVVVLVRMLSP